MRFIAQLATFAALAAPVAAQSFREKNPGPGPDGSLSRPARPGRRQFDAT